MSSPSSAPAVLLPELPAGLLRDKGEAREVFLRHGLPQRGSPAAERWKYTPLGKMAGTRLHLPHEGQAEKLKAGKVANTIADKQDEIERFPEASLLLFVDGRLQDHARAPNITPYAGLPRVTADQPLAALNVGSRCEAWRVVLDEDTPFLHVLFLASKPDDSLPLSPLASTLASTFPCFVANALTDRGCVGLDEACAKQRALRALLEQRPHRA